MRVPVLALAVALFGCTPTPIVEAARGADLEAFRARLAERLADSEPIDASEARAVALGAGAREVERARGEIGRQTLLALRPCAAEFDAALEARSSGDDEAAAWAAFLRADAGSVAAQSYVDRLGDPFDGWRAAGARTLGRERSDEARAWRVRLLRDPSAIVREAAAMSATAAAGPDDLAGLLEAARLDPDEQVRALAIEGVGVLGGEDAVLRLKDVWVGASAEDRVRIVAAWATPASRAAGGVIELERLLTRETGRVALAVALALLAEGGPEGGETREVALATLERIITDGSSAERAEAIARAPHDFPALAAAMEKAQSSPDDAVAVAAYARALEGSTEARAAAQKALGVYAEKDNPAGHAALEALARAHDRAALPGLERRAASPGTDDRKSAGALFVALGEYRGALRLLGDADARVRGSVACAIVKGP